MTQQPTRILIIGGNGFLGHHIVNHAVEIGWHVTTLSLSSRSIGEKDSTIACHVKADISDSDALKTALKDTSFEYVVNCGGYIDHTLFFNDGRDIIDTHFNGVLNFAEILNRNVLKAFVNIGSSDEYGNTPAPQVETQRESPISPYSLGKVAATHLLQMLYRTENFPATTLRLFLTYGPGQDSRRFLPQIIGGCLDGLSFPTSEGKQLRDFCFVQDVVEAIFAVFARPAARGEVLNIGSGKPITIRQMINTIQSQIGQGTPQFGEIPYRSGENMSLFADISKAKVILGWEPKVTLDRGLGETIRWFKEQA